MKVNRIEGDMNAAGTRFGIVLSRFNASIGERLLEGAVTALTQHGVAKAAIDVARVPGAYELPLAAKTMGASGRYDAIIALGAVIRGETPHFEYVAGECARGLARVALDLDLPVAFGVLTVDNVQQAMERAAERAPGQPAHRDHEPGKSSNKGTDAALAAIEMVNLLKKLRG